MDDIRMFRMAAPGPPGTGITEAQLLSLQSGLADLLANTWRGTPRRDGRSLPAASTPGNSATLVIIPGFSLVTIGSLDPTVDHLVELMGRVRVTTAADMTATVATRIQGIEYGPERSTPTAAGTAWVTCSGVTVVPAGSTAFNCSIHYKTSEATNVTFQEAHLDIRVTPRHN